MAEFNENMARLFFEKLGFFVKTNVKYETGKMGSKGDIDLLIINFQNGKDNFPPNKIILNDIKKDFNFIRFGIVEVKGWHTNTFTPSILNKNEYKIKLNDNQIIKAKDIFFNVEKVNKDVKKIIVLSKLSKQDKYKKDAIEILKSFGYDYIIEFKTIVSYLIEHIDEGDYSWDDIEQTFRIMKLYKEK